LKHFLEIIFYNAFAGFDAAITSTATFDVKPAKFHQLSLRSKSCGRFEHALEIPGCVSFFAGASPQSKYFHNVLLEEPRTEKSVRS
jgi:cytochrome bd-type quinol oxidase subunit 1